MALVGAVSSRVLRQDSFVRISARRLLTDPASEQREIELATRQFAIAKTRLSKALIIAKSAKKFRQEQGIRQI